MADENTCVWYGQSGRQYRYWHYPLSNFRFAASPGNYIFARVNADNQWEPVYIGETDNLQSRCCGTHHKWDCALRNGATHIHAHTTPGLRQARLDEEADLRANYRTPCNDQ